MPIARASITKLLPEKLGGQWDIANPATAVGIYWKNLYTVRNLIIHAGMQPNSGHAERAQGAYYAIRDHLEGRLKARSRTYPRTLLARVGEAQLRERGWLTVSMRKFVQMASSEPYPFWLPYDIAQRSPGRGLQGRGSRSLLRLRRQVPQPSSSLPIVRLAVTASMAALRAVACQCRVVKN
jgi:hypothetical protein